MAVEVARGLPLKDVEVETPLEPTRGRRLRQEVAVVPVLRAGLGMVEGFLRLLPDARVGHVGIYRDEEEHVPIDYYERLPPRLAGSPRLRPRPDARHGWQRGACAESAQARRSRAARARSAWWPRPRGSRGRSRRIPSVRIWTAAVDRELDENAYIRPGLGDAGDRVFGTA